MTKENTPEENARKKTKSHSKTALRIFIIILAVLVVLGGVFLFSLLTNRIIIFHNGIFLGNAEQITLNIEKDEIPKLDKFSGLKEADLRQSSCFREIAQWGEEHPDVQVLYTVPLPESVSYDSATATVDMSAISPSEVMSVSADYVSYLKEVKSAKLKLSDFTLDELDAFHRTYPNISILGTMSRDNWTAVELSKFIGICPEGEAEGTLNIGDMSVNLKDETADFSSLSGANIEELSYAMPALSALKEADFGRDEDGYKMLPAVSGFMQAFPNIKVNYIFTAFNKKININTKTLDFNHITMDDQGEEVRNILAYMPKVDFLDMDFCGVDDEHMAAIRDDFPNVKVVWRIWFGTNYTVRTDAKKILASAPYNGGYLTPENTKSLKYCTDIKYMDIGHNGTLGDISFVSYMPNLEVLIVMMNSLTDISHLADCPHLEFLEVFTNSITDLSPLSDLKELKHLNICNNNDLEDMSPIYGLTQLDRLWIGCLTAIPQDQIEHFKELAPDCVVNDTAYDPHTDWRWGNARYDLLCEQLGYLTYDYQLIKNDPLYNPHPWSDVDMEHIPED